MVPAFCPALGYRRAHRQRAGAQYSHLRLLGEQAVLPGKHDRTADFRDHLPVGRADPGVDDVRQGGDAAQDFQHLALVAACRSHPPQPPHRLSRYSTGFARSPEIVLSKSFQTNSAASSRIDISVIADTAAESLKRSVLNLRG
jgi:hypothetical protein